MNKEKNVCGNCKWCYEGHYEEDGEEPYIKRICLNKYGLAKDYEVYPDDFCSRWEIKDTVARCEGCDYHWIHSSGLEMCDKDWNCSKDMTINDITECEKDYTV